MIGPHSAMELQPSKPSTEKLRFLSDKDSSQENGRASKRSKRNANAILGEGGNKANSADASGTSTPIGEKPPWLGGKAMTKKEARRMMDAKVSEAQQHQQSVETARMATNSMLSGGLFGTKKSYSWLRGPSTPSGFSTPSRVNTTTPSGGDNKDGRPGEPAVIPTKRLGNWREDKEKGSGIQLRDVLFMLEVDGRGRKHVQKAYSKEAKEDRQD